MIRRDAVCRAALRVCDPHFRAFVENPRGRVHSVCERAFNLWDGSDLYAVVAGACYAAPYTGNTDGDGFWGQLVRVGDAVEGRFPVIRIGSGLVLDCSRVRVTGERQWTQREWGTDGGGELPAGSAQECAQNLASGISRYRQYLQNQDIRKGCAYFFRRDCSGEVLPGPGILQEEMNRRLWALLRSAGEPERFAAAGRKLVGAGMGLTPAGDDFLCGMLAALNCCESTASLRAALAGGLNRPEILAATTAVSRQMLKAYLNGENSLLNRRLAACFLTGGREMEEIMKLVEGIGHSSGIDFSAGLAAGFCLVLNRIKTITGVTACTRKQ